MSAHVIRDLVSVRSRPSVVRLDDLGADWITSSFAVTRDVEAHLQTLSSVLARDTGCAAFLIGHYGAGKTHFLAYFTEMVRSSGLDGLDEALDVVTVSMLNYRSNSALEDVVLQALGLEASGEDRRETFAALADKHTGGVVLVLDEVSEFLRSKPSPQDFNEDVRFLQFLGEWAQAHPLWVVAAMQEQIEHTGELESALYRKIKDRFPLRLLLRPSHVRDLLRDGVLIQQAGAAEEVAELASAVRTALPDVKLDEQAFCELYPIHPVTLELLEEIRDLFSQARGVVDFVLTQLEGDASRGVQPFLDRPWGELLTPDRIIDHFRDLFEVQPEFLSLAQTVLPYYERHGRELFEQEAQHELAWRLLKLLMLCHISPQRDELSVAEASAWLLFRPSSIAPDVNRKVIERTLARLANDGRYVRQGNRGFALDLRDDSGDRLEQALDKLSAELASMPEEAVWEQLVPLLADEAFNPFALAGGRWQRRRLRWHFHDRSFAVFFGNGAPPEIDIPAVCIRLPWGEAAATSVPSLIPLRVELTADLIELAALSNLASAPGSEGVRRIARKRLAARGDLLGTVIRNAYSQARIADQDAAGGGMGRITRATPVSDWLETLGLWFFRRRFPSFERFAPAHGPLPKEAYRRLIKVAAEHDLGRFEGDEYVKLVREAYLVPMGLMKREGWSYAQSPGLSRHELVQIVMDMVQHRPPPAAVYERLAEPVYGLVADQVHILLLYLVLQGEIDLVKGRKTFSAMSETLPLPIHYDRVVLGTALSPGQLKSLEELCRGLKVRVPAQWSVAGQRTAVQRVCGRLQPLLESLHGLRSRLEHSSPGSELEKRLQDFIDRCALLHQGTDELQGFELFLHQEGSVRGFLADMVTVETLPRGLDRVMSELSRLSHLLAHPALKACSDPSLATRLDAVGAAPPLDELESVNEWLQHAASAYEAYALDYRRRHDAWHEATSKDPVWEWETPPLARSRQVGVVEQAEEFLQLRRQSLELCCRGLSSLDFQPRCTCGFDGRRGPVDAQMDRMRELSGDIDRGLRLFFRQDAVRERIREWTREGLEVNPETLEYLDRKRDVPLLADVDLVDRYLAGIEVVKTISPDALVKGLEGKVMSAPDLLEELAHTVGRFGDARVRLEQSAARGESGEVVAWCVEQALRHGVALPRGLDLSSMPAIDPEWFGDGALARLESLGLGVGIEDEVCRAILDGRVQPGPFLELSPLIEACTECLRPSAAATAEELVELARRLYLHHHRLSPIVGERWLEVLDELASQRLGKTPPALVEVLERELERQWVVVDCLGLALLPELRDAVRSTLGGWREEGVDVASGPPSSTTDGFFANLAEAGIDHPLHKVNAVDRLLHEQRGHFDDLRRLAAAELEVALRRVRGELESGQDLLIFADHGFRLSRDGRRWQHGGPSSLERLVPVLSLVPR